MADLSALKASVVLKAEFWKSVVEIDWDLVRSVRGQADLRASPDADQSALHAVAYAGHSDLLPWALRSHAVDTRNALGRTPLHLASEMDRAGCVTALVGAGADVNALSLSGLSPLDLACREGNLAAVCALLRQGEALVDVCGVEGRLRPEIEQEIEKYRSRFYEKMQEVQRSEERRAGAAAVPAAARALFQRLGPSLHAFANEAAGMAEHLGLPVDATVRRLQRVLGKGPITERELALRLPRLAWALGLSPEELAASGSWAPGSSLRSLVCVAPPGARLGDLVVAPEEGRKLERLGKGAVLSRGRTPTQALVCRPGLYTRRVELGELNPGWVEELCTALVPPSPVACRMELPQSNSLGLVSAFS